MGETVVVRIQFVAYYLLAYLNGLNAKVRRLAHAHGGVTIRWVVVMGDTVAVVAVCAYYLLTYLNGLNAKVRRLAHAHGGVVNRRAVCARCISQLNPNGRLKDDTVLSPS